MAAWLLIVYGLVAVRGEATTVVPPTFEELVAKAEIVFEGEVIDTRSRVSLEREGEAIFTDVYFRVVKVLKGTVGATTVLEFLGGTVGDRTFQIDGMPTFENGDRDVIFAAPSRRMVSPLVGFMHGRVRITHDIGMRQDLVRKFDGTPLRDVSLLGLSASQAALSLRPAMSLVNFESAVAAEMAIQKAKQP
jgi:hypothetical protein